MVAGVRYHDRLSLVDPSILIVVLEVVIAIAPDQLAVLIDLGDGRVDALKAHSAPLLLRGDDNGSSSSRTASQPS